ncbi:MAG TPA: hypothetical protein DDX86_01155 [Akkermansia sp.]|nr:hypothetical protein [Akkermansia sp.]
MRKYERAASEKGVPLRQWLTDLADEAAEACQLRPKRFPLLPQVRQFPSHAERARRKYSTQIIGNIAAGSLAESDTVPSTIYMERPLSKNEYVVRVEGKSMEPLIPDGSLVVMRRHTAPPIPKPGAIVEYNDGRGVTLKKLIRRKNEETGKTEYVLRPINPVFKDITPMDGGSISGIYVETLVNYRKG